jgi:hypothetical protein
MNVFLQRAVSGCLLILLLLNLYSCTGSRKHAYNTITAKKQLATCVRPGLQYELYQLPPDTASLAKAGPYTKFSIRVINTDDNASPLRRLCRNLDEYNTYYEYLLNGAPEDLQLIDNGTVLYPVSYSFENNYNVFPFETINVGYRYAPKKHKRRSGELKMIYTDRVFARDTIVFHLLQTNL